jgi:excisionase family DNA binding protein
VTENWLTVDQVAERIQLHPDTVRLWLRTGRIKGTKLSRRAGYRIPETELQRVLSGEDQAKTAA